MDETEPVEAVRAALSIDLEEDSIFATPMEMMGPNGSPPSGGESSRLNEGDQEMDSTEVRDVRDRASTSRALQQRWIEAVRSPTSAEPGSQRAGQLDNSATRSSPPREGGPSNPRQTIVYSAEARNIPVLDDAGQNRSGPTSPRVTPPRTFLSAIMISPSDTSVPLRRSPTQTPAARSPSVQQETSSTTIRIPLTLPTDPVWANLPTEDQSQALLNSLQNLRSTLAARVETLSVEVERLRRRAEELEGGVRGEASERVEANNVGREQGRPHIGGAIAASEVVSSAAGLGTAGAQNDLVIRTGSGVGGVEEGKLERRARRLAAIRAKVDPEQCLDPVPLAGSSANQLATETDPVSRRHTWVPAVPAPLTRQEHVTTRWPRITTRREGSRRSEERLFASGSSDAEAAGSPSPSSPAVNRPDIQASAELDRLRNLLERSAVERRHIRAEAERATQRRAAAGGEGSTGPAVRDPGLTSRGRRVEQSMQSNGTSPETTASTQHILAGATSPQRQAVWRSYTRYRDALLSGPAPDAVLPAGSTETGTAADSIPPYPGMSRGPDPAGPIISIEIPLAVTDAAASSLRSGSATHPPRSEMVQDIRAAARTQEQLGELTRIIASLRERLRNVVAAGNDRGRLAPSADRTGRRPSPPGLVDREASPRRPAFPFAHSPSHPHHRPRIGPDPIAAVVNLDNQNSFDLNFDGNIVFRPIAVREPDRELIARCLSMLPGGREDTPSRWMRMTGTGSSRPRRASASAGFWVRWVAEPEQRGTGSATHRHLDMSSLPRIIAYDFSVSPPEDEAFVRADEVEFHTPRTVLRRHIGPWMHSRVRIAPFETDPPIARWGTSAHVRQAVQSRGGLGPGEFMTLDLRARSINITGAASSRRPATSRGLGASGTASITETTQPQGAGTDHPMSVIPSSTIPIATSDTSTDPDAWLLAFEPAIGQIRAHWRAHHRRQYSGESHPVERRPHAAARPIASAVDDPADMWSRDFMDADGMPLPAIPLLSTGVLRDPNPAEANDRHAVDAEEDMGVRVEYV